MLTNVAPVATNTIKSNISEIAAIGGYVVGGNLATFVSDLDPSGTYKLILGPVTFSASGASIGPFRYAVLYNSTAASGPLIAWYDYGENVTVTSPNNFVVNFDQNAGVLTLA